jgi:hypothetical protein
MRPVRKLSASAALKVDAGAAATSVRVRASPACRRPDVVTREGSAPPTALQVEYGCPDRQRDERDENDQKNDHHDLFPEVFSAYARQSALGVLSIDFVSQHRAATTPYGTGEM